MFGVWDAVKVTAQDHARAGQAGVVFATKADHPDEVAVRFDADSAVVLVSVTDLQRLG
ncbi:hypothetical protein [Variovorax sp. UMC13]|uniref:hypothetical protein n=1 Tax=Variovorax sp. UMC13 TaxID=1862326 RepID=UPI0016045A64|nr:hypothetical protein [Variovorax sp. UMC13]